MNTMFQSRHYEAIAATLKGNKPQAPGRAYLGSGSRQRQSLCDFHRCIVDQIANLFAQDSPRFKRTKFLEACGV